MPKAYLGIDIGHDMMKLALVSGGAVKKTVSVSMPVNLFRDGHLTSTEAFGTLLAETMRAEHIRANRGAVVLSGEACYLRTTAMPKMNEEQLAINLPYEFSDYVTGELRDYLFDYAVIPPLPDAKPEEGEENRMPLLVAAVHKDVMEEWRAALRKAGVRLAKAAPAECAYLALIRDYEERTGRRDQDHCVIDLGSRAIRMYLFHGPRHMATRVLDVGLAALDQIVAEERGVDVHLAHTYLVNNFEKCQEQESCKSAYDNIAVELMRALNFYRFSNGAGHMDRVFLGGGGAVIKPLRDVIASTLGVEVSAAAELIPGGSDFGTVEDAAQADYVPAIGVALG